jgi:hypothetical protein
MIYMAVMIAICAIFFAGLMREESPSHEKDGGAPDTNIHPVLTYAEQDVEPKGMLALEVIEKMRGFSMQSRHPRSDGKPDPDSIRREEIMAEFRRMGKEAVPAIARVLKDSDVQMRRNATLVLIELAGDWTGKPTVDTRIAIPSLISATEDPDHQVRAWAAHALAEIGPDAKQAVPILIQMLKDPKEGPRNTSAMALGRIGAAAKTALPALREALKDPKEDVRHFYKTAIAQIEKACAQNDQETK